MLKPRIIAVLVVKDGIVVQSVGFSRYLPVGKPEIAVEYLNQWGIDEIVLLDIDATKNSRSPDYALVAACARVCQVPLTVGGGISSIKNIENLILSGADKVALNSVIVNNPALISEGAHRYGNQCIVASIDVRKIDRNYQAFIPADSKDSGRPVIEFAKQVEEMGAGEILLNSIDRDGAKTGYDIELVKQVAGAVSIPVIACGGAGRPAHLLAPVQAGAAAVAAANFFHYMEHSVIAYKRFLSMHGMNLRLDSYADYAGLSFDDTGRLVKQDEDVLEHLRFRYIPQEII